MPRLGAHVEQVLVRLGRVRGAHRLHLLRDLKRLVDLARARARAQDDVEQRGVRDEALHHHAVVVVQHVLQAPCAHVGPEDRVERGAVGGDAVEDEVVKHVAHRVGPEVEGKGGFEGLRFRGSEVSRARGDANEDEVGKHVTAVMECEVMIYKLSNEMLLYL